MRRFFILSLILISSLTFKTFGKKEDYVDYHYKSAMDDYRKGSYYSALETITKILGYQKDRRFKDILLLTSKLYLQIGKKTGLKEYLWKANYYLNFYIQAGGKDNSDYYYTKASIFERLSFYERAFTLYKMALMINKDSSMNNDILFGLMRTAIMSGNVDAFSRYLLHLAPLSYGESKEFMFLMGMKYFYEGKYKLAMDVFEEVYRDFELYLLDNPDFYYYVGQTAFLDGNYEFAKKIFRKIVTQVKNDDVIRKSYIRLGDIATIQKDKNEAFNSYLIVINRFPETQENVVARLKMLSLIDYFPDMRDKVMKVKDLEDPVKFVVRTLISNRTNYIGKYAIGNFGVLVFKNRTDYLIDRLSWELSLIYPLVLNPEQKLYIKTLYSPYLEKLPEKDIVKLYYSNQDFFMQIFDKSVLKKILTAIRKTDNMDEYIKLLDFMVVKYNDDEDKRELAIAYFYKDNTSKALEILMSINDKKCYDDIFIETLQGKIGKYLKDCDISNLPFDVKVSYLFSIYKLNKNQEILSELIKTLTDKPPTIKDRLPENIQTALTSVTNDLFLKKEYGNVVKILRPYVDYPYKDESKCDIVPIYLISKIRTSDLKNIDEIYGRIKNCDTEYALIAKEIYKNQKFIREVQ